MNVIRLLLLTLVILPLLGCIDLCGNEILQEVHSPDKSVVASIIKRDCGATTPYVTAVLLRMAGEELDVEDVSAWVFTIHSESEVSVEWQGDSKLKIDYTWTGDKPTMYDTWRHIKIFY